MYNIRYEFVIVINTVHIWQSLRNYSFSIKTINFYQFYKSDSTLFMYRYGKIQIT